VSKLGSSLAGGFAYPGGDLDRREQSVQLILRMAQVQGEGKICRRFGGGSDRNRALLGNPVQPVHDMQMVQSRINTGYFASC
jgi:hypothetical protein